jgi:uncharacterized protein YfdQ (DUF2303 family)
MNTPATNISQARSEAPLADALQVSLAMQAMTGAALEPREIDGAHFIIVPPNYRHEDITELVEKNQPTPSRKRGEVQLRDVASLLDYVADQAAQDGGYIYADPDSRTITAVLNDQRAGDAPGWRDHRATFKAEYTPEFANWLSHDGSGKAMGQSDFAEFIEDNLADITDPAAHQLLEVATTIAATSGINFASAKRLQDGQVQLQYTENIEARAGVNGALTIPKEFTLGLRIFKNGGGYKLRARLKYRLGGGSIKFWYELDRPERSVEDAFGDYVTEIREKSGYRVLIGRP